MIFLLRKIGAEDAVTTSDEEAAEVAVGAIFTKGERCAAVGFIDAEAIVAELGIVEVRTISRIFAALEELAVEAFLTVLGGVNEVTIFAVGGTGRVFTIFIADLYESHAGNFLMEFCPLLKESPRKIKRASIIHGIPMIAIPLFGSVDCIGLSPEWCFLIERNDLSIGVGRDVFVEEAFVSVAGAILQSAGRAEHFEWE